MQMKDVVVNVNKTSETDEFQTFCDFSYLGSSVEKKNNVRYNQELYRPGKSN